jgi:predicted RNase H-like HicB family nuclease
MSTTTSLHTGRKAPRPGSRSVGAHVVRVHVHEEDGCWWAETPDYPGLTITEASKDALLDAIRPAVEFHLHESDVDLTAGIRLAISLPSSGLGLA